MFWDNVAWAYDIFADGINRKANRALRAVVAEAICREADARYRAFCREMPDLGRNLMAANMLDWFTILAFYEASGRRLDGEALLTIKRRAVERL